MASQKTNAWVSFAASAAAIGLTAGPACDGCNPANKNYPVLDAAAEYPIPRGSANINANVEACPTAPISLAATPATAIAGQTISLSALVTASDAGTASYTWSVAPAMGTFSQPHALSTSFICGVAGPLKFTLTVTEGNCSSQKDVPYFCYGGDAGVAVTGGTGGGAGGGGTNQATGGAGATATGGTGNAATGGAGAYRAFLANTRKHQATPLTNHMGLRTVVAYRPSEVGRHLIAESGTDPWLRWKEARLAAWHRTWPVAALLAAAALFLLGRAALRRPEPWIAAALGTLWIAFAVELTSYYYAFLIVPALLWTEKKAAGIALLILAAFSQWVSLGPGMPTWRDEQYTLISLATLLVFGGMLASFAFTGRRS